MTKKAPWRCIKEKELPWPQPFDGKGWENKFGVRQGIFSIPTRWLVDRRGNLQDINAGSDLERRVTALLGEHAHAIKGAVEDKPEALEIRVTILPIENQDGWFEMEAVVEPPFLSAP